MEFGYRFRYEVEGKAHGGLQGRSSKNAGSKRGAKVYPEIQVGKGALRLTMVHSKSGGICGTSACYHCWWRKFHLIAR